MVLAVAVRETVPTSTDDADRSAWSAAGVKPLWEIPQAHAQPESQRAGVWPWRTMAPLVARAVALASPDVAERRVLSLIAPSAMPGEFHTITNLNAGLQILLPGEMARPHRHSMDALRFVFDGDGAVTRVDGKVAAMARGDLVLTPGNCWHEHWHDGDKPIVWLDVLNVHTHQFLDTLTFEPGPAHDVPELPPDTLFAHGNMLPEVAPQRFSPVFRYPLADAAAAVALAPRGADGARRVRYINPLTGGPVMPFLDCALVQLDPGQTTIPARTSAHAVCAVVAGSGETRIGDQCIAWEANDVFTIPNGVATVHSGTSPAHLFVVSDRELYRRLDLLTEVYG